MPPDTCGRRLLMSRWYEACSTQLRHLTARSRRLLVVVCAVTLWIATILGKYVPVFAVRYRFAVIVMVAVIAVVIGLCVLVFGYVIVAEVATTLIARKRKLRVALFGWFMLSVFVIGLVNGASAWWATDVPQQGPCEGVATLVQDPEKSARATVAVVSLDGIRYRAIAYGVSQRRLMDRLMGEQVHVTGTCEVSRGRYGDWDRQRHILGTLSIDTISEEFSYGSPLYRSANKLRRHIVKNMAAMHEPDRALFTGLIMGDDRNQPQSMIDSFRATGLSHLCAVSGQNVAYVLAVAGVFLRSRRTSMRLVLTCALLAWFVVLTRVEPSVVRAAVMAGMVALAFAWGKTANTKEVLALTAIVMLCIDPMMARSVGFMLSTAATAGLAWLLPLTNQIVGTRAIQKTIAATMAAHLGTALISLFFFGSLPVIALVTNPIAVPLASLVMLIGLPVSLGVSALPEMFHVPLVYALQVPVRLLWWIAVVGDAVSPRGFVNFVCWCGVGWWCITRYRRFGNRSDLRAVDVQR